MKTLGIYQFLRNGVKYDYPFEESLRSALAIADKVCVCECQSEDDTNARLLKLKEEFPDKLNIVYTDWVSNHSELSMLGNYASLFLDTDWKWQLQADEVLHEDQFEKINGLLRDGGVENYEMINKCKVTAITTKYNHFLANYETTFPFCYTEIVRIYKAGCPWKLVGDACELAGGNPAEIMHSDITVNHYGKVHQGHVGWQKEWDFQQLYTDIGFPDPKMKEMEEKFGEQFCDYIYLFENHIKENNIKRYEGTHPSFMQERIKAFKGGGWEQFISKMKDGLEITLKNKEE